MRKLYRTAILEFVTRLGTNTYESHQMIAVGFDIPISSSYFKPACQIGRLGVALGWISSMIIVMRSFCIGKRLAVVGHMGSQMT